MNKVDNPVIELYSNTSKIMCDAIDRIVVEIYNKPINHDKARKIVLTGCGPQCGTTTTSIGLGISFAEAKWKTLIIDCDMRRMASYKKLNDTTDVGLSDVLIESANDDNPDFDEIVYPTNFDNLSYIPCGKYVTNPARLFGSAMMEKLIAYANENFDYVIFDFPSIDVAPDAQILFGKVDGIILISALNMVTKRQIRNAKHKVVPFADKYYGMIINRIELNVYKRFVKKFDYYFKDKHGSQKLGGNVKAKVKQVEKRSKKEKNNEKNK